MLKRVPSIFICIIGLLITLLLVGCSQKSPPNIDEVYEEFQENQRAFQLVAEYFSSIEHQSIFVNYDDDFFWADFHQYPFSEMKTDVYDAINHMFTDKGYLGISKNDTQLGVEFRMWTDHRAIDCGVIYAIHKDTKPQPEFVVELLPLPEEGWYYYISNYNEWRSQQIQSN